MPTTLRASLECTLCSCKLRRTNPHSHPPRQGLGVPEQCKLRPAAAQPPGGGGHGGRDGCPGIRHAQVLPPLLVRNRLPYVFRRKMARGGDKKDPCMQPIKLTAEKKGAQRDNRENISWHPSYTQPRILMSRIGGCGLRKTRWRDKQQGYGMSEGSVQQYTRLSPYTYSCAYVLTCTHDLFNIACYHPIWCSTVVMGWLWARMNETAIHHGWRHAGWAATLW